MVGSKVMGSAMAAAGADATTGDLSSRRPPGRDRRLWAFLMLGLLSLPAVGGGDGSLATSAKIRFDMSVLDASGLYGPPDGLRAMSYEFCIPDRPETAAEVRDLDKTVAMHKARGRIGCSNRQLLCIGHTHQADFRAVLEALSALPYVARIDQAFFE
jgi:hypothetical protein